MGLFDFFKKPPQIPHDSLTVWLHRKTYFEMLRFLDVQKGREPLHLVPVNDVFWSTAALITPDGMRPVRDEELKGLGLPLHQAYARGIESAVGLTSATQTGGVYAWSSHLSPLLAIVGQAMAKRLELKGKPVVMVPTQHLALMVGDEDLPALAQMIDMAEKAYAESTEPCSLQAVSWQDPAKPQSSAWLPPHAPLRAKYLAGAAKTRRTDASTMHELLLADHAALAPLAVMPAERGGHLVASWFRDADLVMPLVDRVMLLDTDDAQHSRLEVDFELLLDTLPQAFDPIALADGDEPPRFFRMRGLCFPTPSERAFLKAAMSHLEVRASGAEREISESEALQLWDAGLPMLAEAANESQIALRCPDCRIGMVSIERFGARMEKRSARDQATFQTSFMSLAMLHNMVEPTEHASQIIDSAREKMTALQERIEAERPMLLSSATANRSSFDDIKGMPPDAAKILAGMLDPARLFPVVRPPGHGVGAHNNQLGMATAAVNGLPVELELFDRVNRPFIDGLTLELVTDLGTMMAPLRADVLPGPLNEAAWRSAMLNLRASSVEPPRRESPGVYVLAARDEYDASRALLLPALTAEGCEVQGDPLVFVPSLARVWVTGSHDEVGIWAVLDAIDAYLASPEATSPYQFRLMLFGAPWVLRSGVLTRWSTPNAALSARIAALDERLEKRRASSTEHVRGFAAASHQGAKQGQA